MLFGDRSYNMAEEKNYKRPWYKQWWGAIIIAILVLIALFFIYFGYKVYGFYSKIKSGEISTAELSFDNKFTVSNRLRSQLAPAETDLDLTTTDDPQIGDPEAPLTVVEFADFGCSFSREESFIIREVATENPTLVHYIYRDFPVDDLHPQARLAAEAGECAQDQGLFWAYHDKLYQNQDDLSKEALVRRARESGLEGSEFVACLDSGKYKTEVEEDFQIGVKAGVSGTPTFFINGKRVEGAIPRDVWDQIIGAFLMQ